MALEIQLKHNQAEVNVKWLSGSKIIWRQHRGVTNPRDADGSAQYASCVYFDSIAYYGQSYGTKVRVSYPSNAYYDTLVPMEKTLTSCTDVMMSAIASKSPSSRVFAEPFGQA